MLTLPPGLYGHSAVYHEATDSLYVFGGFRFHVELAAPSPELYSLHCPDRTWSLLAPSQGAKVRKKGQTDESGGWWQEGPSFPSAPGSGSTLDSYSASFPVPSPKSPLLLSDLEVRIIHQEIRGLCSDLVLPHSGCGLDRPLPFLAPPAMKQGAEVSCASTSKAKSISVSESRNLGA